MSHRHTIVVIDESTKVIRRVPVSLPALVAIFTAVISFPVLVGIGAKLSVRAELDHLQAMHRMLEAEGASYRAEITAFTEQIRSLDEVVGTLPVATSVRARAAGGSAPGPSGSAVPAALPPSLSSPEEILKVLQGALQVLSDRLPSVARGIERREALAAAAPSIWPAQGWLTDRFGMRSDPLTGQQGFHPGLDISTPEGQPVYATAAGVVDVASYSGDFGNLVELRHDFGLSTRYAHLSRFAVVPGASVARGDVVGYVGATGRATGAHVHYEILANGTPIDPLQILTTIARP